MISNVKIRKAQVKDIPWIVNEQKNFNKFFDGGISILPDEEFAYTLMKRHIDDHVLLVAESEDKGLLGFIAGMYHYNLFNPKILMLTETFWWVADEHRGTRAALMLLNEYTEIAKGKVNIAVFTLEDKSPVNQ